MWAIEHLENSDKQKVLIIWQTSYSYCSHFKEGYPNTSDYAECDIPFKKVEWF